MCTDGRIGNSLVLLFKLSQSRRAPHPLCISFNKRLSLASEALSNLAGNYTGARTQVRQHHAQRSYPLLYAPKKV